MKHFFLFLFTLSTLSAFSQTYLFVDDFESYNSFSSLGTQGGYNSNMDIYPYGLSGSKGLIAQMFSIGAASRATTTPLIGPFTATTEVSFSYKILTQNAPVPSSYTMGVGDSVNVYVIIPSFGNLTLLISSLNSSNQLVTGAFQKLVIPGDAAAQNFSGKFKIEVIRAAGNEFYVDMDSLEVKDSGGAVGLTIVPTVSQITCNGAANGAVTQVDIFGGTPLYTYNWSNGSTEQVLFDLTPGNYTLTVSDANTQSGSIVVTITEPDAVSANVTHINASSASATDGSLTISANGGTSPYQFSKDGGSTFDETGVFNNLAVGCYTPFIRDANQCDLTLDTVCVTFSSSIDNIENEELFIYPNPAKDVLNINNTLANSTIEIYNSIGKLVLRKNINNSYALIDISMLSMGSYYIRFEKENG
ncbi:MAG: T9SS type A sorting domain-containing protein, partial [Pseudomonadota bacterium]